MFWKNVPVHVDDGKQRNVLHNDDTKTSKTK